MKIMCDCGNIEKFNTIDEETGEQTPVREDEGQYATIEKFDFWETHDQVGIVCKKCELNIFKEKDTLYSKVSFLYYSSIFILPSSFSLLYSSYSFSSFINSCIFI